MPAIASIIRIVTDLCDGLVARLQQLENHVRLALRSQLQFTMSFTYGSHSRSALAMLCSAKIEWRRKPIGLFVGTGALVLEIKLEGAIHIIVASSC